MRRSWSKAVEALRRYSVPVNADMLYELTQARRAARTRACDVVEIVVLMLTGGALVVGTTGFGEMLVAKAHAHPQWTLVTTGCALFLFLAGARHIRLPDTSAVERAVRERYAAANASRFNAVEPLIAQSTEVRQIVIGWMRQLPALRNVEIELLEATHLDWIEHTRQQHEFGSMPMQLQTDTTRTAGESADQPLDLLQIARDCGLRGHVAGAPTFVRELLNAFVLALSAEQTARAPQAWRLPRVDVIAQALRQSWTDTAPDSAIARNPGNYVEEFSQMARDVQAILPPVLENARLVPSEPTAEWIRSFAAFTGYTEEEAASTIKHLIDTAPVIADAELPARAALARTE